MSEGAIENALLKSQIPSDPQADWVPALIPHFFPRQETLYLLKGLEIGHVWIYGETGLGKTQSVYWLAHRLKRNLREINLCGEISADQLVGYLSLKDHSMHFQKGLLPLCMEQGHWLLLDELDYASPAVLSLLNSALQTGTLTIPETGERVVAQPGFRVIVTANTHGGGDHTGFYQGTHFLNKALLDRFETVIEVQFPEPSELKQILKSHFAEIPEEKRVMQFIAQMRYACENQELYFPFGIRTCLKFVRKACDPDLSWKESALLAFGNFLDPASRVLVLGIVQRVFGE